MNPADLLRAARSTVASLRPMSARCSLLLMMMAPASGPAAAQLAPLAPEIAPAWRPVGLPPGKAPPTRFVPVTLDGVAALRLETDASYGTLVHAVPGGGGTLSWRWRLDRPVAAADLRTQAGDDAALKVCAMFDLPLSALPFWERQTMRLARSVSGEDLPAATLCYVWDPALPAGTLLPNAYSRRLRWIVLQGQGAPLAAWRSERRDLQADFLRAFGDESPAVPPLKAIAIGADADNTRGASLGHVAGLDLQP